MQYDIKSDWKLGAESWTCAAPLPPVDEGEPEDLPQVAPEERKYSARVRLAILVGGALASWILFAAIAWALLAMIHLFLGH